ncbi:helix-turn-helix domain-containing protein [Gordonia sp. HY285]|uniref:helix-turn-helix domain-containing protein n=1 Tax=Gordonia liuliyuniae TaxID=2911517 RepID=UPI001F17AB46|nr:helix-turn-helix domain-containing protein [Gordonia liuliyuniae]MCF8608754.1 helix-turn-helix domain-containing protein [Gordonia liuliyuniae]
MEFRDVRGLTGRLCRAGVLVTPYDIRGARPGTHLGIPSPTVTLIVDLRDGLLLTGPGLARPTSFRCGIGELHLESFTIHHDGAQVGVQLDLTPGAVRRLFGVPVGSLASMLELDHLDAAFASRLRDAVGSVPHDARSAVATDLLSAQLGDAAGTPTGVDPDAVRTWQRILRSNGRVTVSELVEQSGWSARRLTGVFTAEFGMGPKQAARLVRFDTARHAIDSGRAPSDVAADCGFADQAHMSREFTAFTGLPPTQYLIERDSDFLVADHADEPARPTPIPTSITV